jgi:hypothetical protein
LGSGVGAGEGGSGVRGASEAPGGSEAPGARGDESVGRRAVLDALTSPAASSARVLRLVSELPDAQEWMGADEYAQFEAQVRGWVDLWCCARIEKLLTPAQLERLKRNDEIALKTKSHIYYDLFWDKLPHTDKVGRTWTTPWRPIPGEKWDLTEPMSEPWRSMLLDGVDPRKASAKAK